MTCYSLIFVSKIKTWLIDVVITLHLPRLGTIPNSQISSMCSYDLSRICPVSRESGPGSSAAGTYRTYFRKGWSWNMARAWIPRCCQQSRCRAQAARPSNRFFGPLSLTNEDPICGIVDWTTLHAELNCP
jgi:hypothetical protein